MPLTDKQLVLVYLVAAQVEHSGMFQDHDDYVKDARRLANVILDQDENWIIKARRVPAATPEVPWDGVVWTGGPKFVIGWFDGTTWRRNNSGGVDITAAVTHWRNLQPPDTA